MEKLKTTNEFQVVMLKLTIAFWLIETVVFLFIEGWHWKATSEAEIFCDKIVNFMVLGWFLAFISTLQELINFIIKENED